MSATIWQAIQEAVKEKKPELADDFMACRDRESISNFLDLHFPLEDDKKWVDVFINSDAIKNWNAPE
jgi:hypothetical protein